MPSLLMKVGNARHDVPALSWIEEGSKAKAGVELVTVAAVRCMLYAPMSAENVLYVCHVARARVELLSLIWCGVTVP